jgi:hypothetical protein
VRSTRVRRCEVRGYGGATCKVGRNYYVVRGKEERVVRTWVGLG